MSKKQKRFILPEDEIPKYWYNIQADMKTKPLPPLNPATKKPLTPEDLYSIFAKELCHQELNQTDAWIEIPEAVREMRSEERFSRNAETDLLLASRMPSSA